MNERGTTGICWVETRDAAKQPTLHITAIHNNKNDLAQDADDAKAEKLYCNCHLDHNSFREKNMESDQPHFRVQLSAAVASVSARRCH